VAAALGRSWCRGANVMTKHHITPAAQRAGTEARIARANQKVAELAPVIAELRVARITTPTGIAAALIARGVRPTWGHRYWYPSQVARVGAADRIAFC
jgi:hypothetical protein